MSFNRLRYDSCAYRNDLAQEIGTFSYVIDDCRFVHKNPKRLEFGIVGGNDVSIISKNQMVDLESELKGQTRLASRCPILDYQNPCPSGDINMCNPKQVVIRSNPGNKGRVLDTTLHHLPPAQMFRYTPIPVDPYMGVNLART